MMPSHQPLITATPSSDQRWKIAIVTETYPPEINGVAHTMRQLAEGLAARGQMIQLIRPRQPRDASAPAPSSPSVIIDEQCLPGLPIPGYRGLRFGLPAYGRLRRLWQGQGFDLVYIATPGPLGQTALMAARALDIPTLTGFHTHFQRYSQHYGIGWLMRPITASLRRFHNRSDATLVPTAELCASLTADGFANVHVFGRGVDTERFAPTWRSADLRRAWGCGDADLVALYVGRIAAEKNLTLALEGFRALQQTYPTARLVLVGDGPERQTLQRQHPDLIFAGARVGAELAAHYASGDLFVFPSLTETFGNVVTEAMASGLPVIAFDYAAAHEYLQSGVNGITVPFNDQAAFVQACRASVADREHLRRLGQAARASALTLGWERVLKRVEEQAGAVIQHRRRQAEGAYASLATSSD